LKPVTFLVPALAGVLGLVAGVLLAPVVRPPDAEAEAADEEKTAVARPIAGRGPEAMTVGTTEDPDSDGDFVEAVDVDKLVEEEEPETATVEEVRDEDGLTPDERAAVFRRENPEEWERIRKRRAAALEVMRQAAAERQGFLDTIDKAHLTAEQRKEHAAYAEALAVRNAARERIEAAHAAGKEAAVADYASFTKAERTLTAHAAGERRLLLEATARALGLENDDVPAFLEILERIDSCTRDLH